MLAVGMGRSAVSAMGSWKYGGTLPVDFSVMVMTVLPG